MRKIIIYTILLGFIAKQVPGQQNPQYTQYMYNLSLVNPAYAGSKEGVNINTFYRSQWVGIKDAPRTATLGLDASVGNNLGIGLSVISDKLGPLTENSVFADISYAINLGTENKLAFGLKGGLNFVNADFPNEIVTINSNDIAFRERLNRMLPNFGIGLFYYSEAFYVGASIPNILETLHFEQNESLKAKEKTHTFFTAGYVMIISDELKFKPSTMIKTVEGSPISIDLSANLLMHDNLEFGISSRFGESFAAMVNVKATEKLRIGYAYDFTYGVGNVSSGSHEIFLLYNFLVTRSTKSYRRTTRYF